MKSIVFLALFAVALAAPQGDADAPIVRQQSDINPDGSYSWSYETGNGIAADEQGSLKKGPDGDFIAAQGQFVYTGEDGQQITLTYVADENGFQPQGAHLPTPPPIPEAIQRAIAYNAANPEKSRR